MARWLWWLPLGLLTLAVGLMSLRLGWLAATLSETDVINSYAKRYVTAMQAEHPGEAFALTDCVALPSEERGVWLMVLCGKNPCDPARYFEYHVNRIGGLVRGGDNVCPEAMVKRALA